MRLGAPTRHPASPPRIFISKRLLSRVSVALGWLVILALCALVLAGRYSWSAEVYRYSLRGYLSSVYMLVLTLPVMYYLLRYLSRSTRIASIVTAIAAGLFTLPYRWLGLERWAHHKDRPTGWPMAEPPSFEWFPEALLDFDSMPHEIAFFVGLALAGSSVAFAWQRHKRGRTRNAALWLGLYVLILVQTWAHLSMRNPQIYSIAFAKHEKLADSNYFRLMYLFPDSQGAVSQDYVHFRAMEEHFMGLPKETSTMYLRRGFPFYLSSQLSYFFSPFYVFLVLNSTLWLVSAICAYLFARPLWGSRIAAYFAALVGCGSGFIAFSASPRVYLVGFAAIMLLVFLFEVVLVRNEDRKTSSFLLFGGILGLGAMVYDIFSLCIYFVGYGLLRRLPWAKLMASLAVASGIYAGFLLLQSQVLGLSLANSNSVFIGNTFTNIISSLLGFELGKIYALTASLPWIYVGDLSHAFLVLPLLLAICGAFLMRDRSQIAVLLLLALPSLANIAFLHYGEAVFKGNTMAAVPRFAYSAYPAVYLMAAFAISELRRYLIGLNRPRLAELAAGMAVASIFVLNNIDVLGYPEIYYLFFMKLGTGL